MTRSRTLVERWYPEKRFGGFTHVDGTVAFYERVNGMLQPQSVVLDLGCGRGVGVEDAVPWRSALRNFKGRCKLVIGADVDPAAATNPTIDQFCVIVDGRVQVPDEHVDLCIADFVLEHVQDVDAFFSEAVRVLRPGGFLCLRTPNVWNYMGIASRLIPNQLHVRVLGRVQPDRAEEDVFPTVYRCNSVRRLRNAFARHGLDGVVLTQESEPAYLSFSKILYALAVFHQRHAPPPIRRMLLAYARKPES